MHLKQHTLKTEVSCTGIGLHSGKKVNMLLRPADPDTGVTFKRTDLPGAALIPGDVHHVVDTRLCTTVGNDDGVTVSTVEHLMSALAALGVDNVLVEVDSPEIPIMDGSAAPFAFIIKGAGLARQSRNRLYYMVKRPISLSEGDKRVTLTPAAELGVNFTIEFDHPLIRRQHISFHFNEKSYEKDISRARTFGFLEDVRWMQENNLALGGSLDNAVMVDKFRVLNEDGLRFPDEFVRHKVLDLIGDLALVGRPVIGGFTAFKSGHELNNKLFRKFLADPQAWQLTSLREAPLPAAASAPAPGPAPMLEPAAA